MLPQNMLGLDPGFYVEVRVIDTGSGIPAEYIDQVFDPYFTTQEEKTGLGLAVCYSIIQQHGGHIDLESVPGEGTTVTFTLPALGPDPGPEAEVGQLTGEGENGLRERAEPPETGRRILLMDDEEMLRIFTRKMLNKLGYAVETAANGEEVLERYREALDSGEHFDVVILDLSISGGMGGKETMKLLQELDPDVAGIVTSGYFTDPVMSEYAKYGFRARLNKPFFVEEMQEALAIALSAAESPRKD